jgi:hypothetical protein
LASKKETKTIAGNGHWGSYQGGRFGGNWQGSAVITSNQPVVAIANQIHTDGRSLSQNSFLNGATKIYLPLMLNGSSGWSTSVYLMNASGNAASGTIKYCSASGALQKAISIGLPARGYQSRPISGEGVPTGFIGSAVIEMNQPVVAVVSELKAAVDGMGYGATVNPVTTAELAAVMDNAYGGWSTVMIVQNVGSATATVTIKYYGVNGAPLGVKTETNTVPVGVCWRIPQSGKLSGQPGSAVITSSQPAAVIVNEYGPGGNNISYSGTP